MKHYEYVITTKIPDYKRIDRISQLLLFLAIIVFVFTSFQNWHSASTSPVIRLIAAGFIAVYWLYCRIMATKKDRVPYYRIGFSIAVIGWLSLFSISKWSVVIAIFYLIAAFLERQVKFPEEIGVDKSGITFNSFPKKHHPWNELTNLVIKDNIITIDYKNNKIFQKEIESDVSYDVEKEFNHFCSQQLSRS
jgi:hypothetical protein